MFDCRNVRRVAIGALAGGIGTIAMDSLWFARYRRDGGTDSPLEWEFGGVDGWGDVSAPGKVGERVLTFVRGRRPPSRWAATTQTVVHWMTGASWGAALALSTNRVRQRCWGAGPLLGLTAWLTSYAVLPTLGIYKPIWRYDARTLTKDLSAHLVFGTTTSASFALLTRSIRARDV